MSTAPMPVVCIPMGPSRWVVKNISSQTGPMMPPTKIGVGIFSLIKDAEGGAVSLIEVHANDC